ncbi:MAG: HigA family addiction module antitoxin [Gallionella sp.]
MTRMHNPPHPGEVLKDGVMVDGVTVTGLAEKLGVTRVALSRILNTRAGISADMALKLARVFGGSAESWLYLQANYDLWQAERRAQQHHKPVYATGR